MSANVKLSVGTPVLTMSPATHAPEAPAAVHAAI